MLAGRQDSYLAIYGGRKGDEKMRQLYIQVNKQEMARQHYHRCGNLMSLLKDQRSTLIPTVLHIAPTIYL